VLKSSGKRLHLWPNPPQKTLPLYPDYKEDYGLYYDEGHGPEHFRAFDEMTDKELETPLTNSGLSVKAKLAPNSGTFVQFRTFGDLALATEANSDSPKMYGETEESSASMNARNDIFKASTQDLAASPPHSLAASPPRSLTAS